MPSMGPTDMIKLPDFLANWPWKRELSPHYEIVKAETDSWVRSFGFFKDAKSQDAFDRVQTPRLAALAYLHMNKDQLRMASDFIALLYVYDEYTDVADEQEAQSLEQIVLDATHNPDKSRPGGRESSRRTGKAILDPSNPPPVTDLTGSLSGNIRKDVYSYNVEVLRGMGLFNLVTIIAYQHGLESTKQAIAWIDEWNGQLLVEFLDIRDKMMEGEVTTRESWSEETLRQVKQYVDILGCWVRANEEWNFESHRYLGTDGPRVRRERTLAMMPKVDINPKVLVGGGPCNDGNDSERIRQLMDETAVAGMQITTKTF